MAHRVSQEPGFVLHSYRYRETSLIVEIFSRHYGRTSLLAKGARRWKKRGTNLYLRPFQQLLFAWSGKGELATLVSAEELPPVLRFGKAETYCGFYLNELMMRLLHKHDPHEALYDYYEAALLSLGGDENAESVLRIFEKHLLNEIGYGMNLEVDAMSGKPIEPGTYYSYLPNQGPTSSTVDSAEELNAKVSGKSLIALRNESLDRDALREIKGIMRRIIDQRLNYKPLASRGLFSSGPGKQRAAQKAEG